MLITININIILTVKKLTLDQVRTIVSTVVIIFQKISSQ